MTVDTSGPNAIKQTKKEQTIPSRHFLVTKMREFAEKIQRRGGKDDACPPARFREFARLFRRIL